MDLSTTYHLETDGQSERTIQTLEDNLRACVIDFGRNYDTHLLKCQTPIAWEKVGESKIIGPEIVKKTTDKIVKIKERLKAIRDHHKSYADKRQKPLEFSFSDKVLLKVSPWKGVVCFGNIVTNLRVTPSWREIVSLIFSEAGVLHVNWISFGHCFRDDMSYSCPIEYPKHPVMISRIVDENIINEHYHKFIHVWFAHMVHEIHKYSRPGSSSRKTSGNSLTIGYGIQSGFIRSPRMIKFHRRWGCERLSLPGQMTHPIAILTLDSARSYLMQSAFLTQGTVSSIPIVFNWGGSIGLEGFRPSILPLTAYAFHQDKASSVRVPVTNVTLFSSAQLVRENVDSVRSNQRMRPTAPSIPLKWKG
nr:putative reverse transcriptase domain-containing protein [Tanacetum cinerariifolium]